MIPAKLSVWCQILPRPLCFEDLDQYIPQNLPIMEDQLFEITLRVTTEQEETIQHLFAHSGWNYNCVGECQTQQFIIQRSNSTVNSDC